jgi:uncharacterized protein with GYD domain
LLSFLRRIFEGWSPSGVLPLTVFDALTLRTFAAVYSGPIYTTSHDYSLAPHVAEQLGGRILSGYVTTGHYDVVITAEMPSGDAMVKFATAISGSGNARTTTVRAFMPEEFAKLASEAPSF